MTTTLGLVFDFDDTLAPDSTTLLLEEYGVDTEQFWSERFLPRVECGYDPTVASLTSLLELVRSEETAEVGQITIDDIESVGRRLDEELFAGLPSFFDEINDIVAEYDGITVEHYVVTEGLEQIVQGTTVAEHCEAVYGSRLATDGDGVVTEIERPISFTDKTRYLFEINKGIAPNESRENPYAVNDSVSSRERHIPFENLVYVGNGVTDVPCFSLVTERNGRAFGVAREGDRSPKRRVLDQIGAPRRAGSLSRPAFDAESRLGSLLRLTVEGLCTDRTLDEREAL